MTASLVDIRLTADQQRVLRAIYSCVTREGRGEVLSWPNWNFVRRELANDGLDPQRADELISTLPEMEVGSRSPYSLIWRSAAGSSSRVQPVETIGLSIAGLLHVDSEAAGSLVRLVRAAADREAALPTEPHSMPSGKWPLNDAIAAFLPRTLRSAREPMNVPTVADLLMHEPIPMASGTGSQHVYEVELGTRLSLFLAVEDTRDYLRALGTLTPRSTAAPHGVSHASIDAMIAVNEGVDEPAGDPRKVFLVHGRNDAAVTAMIEFLHALGLEEISWTDATNEARRKLKRQPYTLEIVTAGLKAAGGVVVLFTPDDLVRLDPRVSKSRESDLAGQARPNVILEAGMVLGMAQEKALFVRIGDQRPITDIDGINFVNIGNSTEQKADLARRLGPEGLGLTVTNKFERWIAAGDFDGAMNYLSEPRPFDGSSGDPEPKPEPTPVMSDLEHREALDREIGSIVRCAQQQGWQVLNNSRRVLRLKGPRGQVCEFWRVADPATNRERLRSFAGQVRAVGLRVSQQVRLPIHSLSSL